MAGADIEFLKVEIKKEYEDVNQAIKLELNEEEQNAKESMKDLHAQIEKINQEYILKNFVFDGENKSTSLTKENGTGENKSPSSTQENRKWSRRRGVRSTRAGRTIQAKKKWSRIRLHGKIIQMIMLMNAESLSKGIEPSDDQSKNSPDSELSEKTKKDSKKCDIKLYTREVLRRQQIFLRLITELLSEEGDAAAVSALAQQGKL